MTNVDNLWKTCSGYHNLQGYLFIMSFKCGKVIFLENLDQTGISGKIVDNKNKNVEKRQK